jgi:hypothetical protein
MPDTKGFISNRQFLELPEFNFCAFKKFLPRGLKLEEVGEENNKRQSFKRHNTIMHRDDFDGDDNNARRNIKRIDNNNFIKEDDKQTGFKKLILNENKDKETMDSPSKERLNERRMSAKSTGLQYISFQKFCEYLRYFNEKCPVDVKIRCILFLNN